MICFCGRPVAARGLCNLHYQRAYAERLRRAGDRTRRLVIAGGLAGIVVAAPDADLLNALLTWEARR